MKNYLNLKSALLKKYKVLTLQVSTLLYSDLLYGHCKYIVKRPAGSICDMLFTDNASVRKYDYVLVECLNSYHGVYVFFEFKGVETNSQYEIYSTNTNVVRQPIMLGDYKIMLGDVASVYTG